MTEYFIGLMSGTSLDGMDAALVSFNGETIQVIATLSTPMPANLKDNITRLCQPGLNEIAMMAQIDPGIARFSAKAVNTLLEQTNFKPDQITAIGSHGQTVRHLPEVGYTLQLGDPSLLAELTGITVVADFRRRDMAAGGQGAPLVPAFHHHVFSTGNEPRAIINIGGISNISVLPADQSEVFGFDTGPGNLLMDYWCQKNLNKAFDENGSWAASAVHDAILLETMLSEPFFRQPPPKSTGRELFNPSWLHNMLEGFSGLSTATVQATLCRLTARGITSALQQHTPGTKAVYVCGGGARNETLMKMLREEHSSARFMTTDELGIAPDWVEAIAFAWLAKQTLNHQPGNLPAVTGATGLKILGGIYPV